MTQSIDTPPRDPRGGDATLDARQHLLALLGAGLAAVDGRRSTREALEARPIQGSTWICAVGKAAEAMALGAWDALGERPRGGLVITKAGHADERRLGALGIETLIGGHPIPDEGSLIAGQRLRTAIDRTPPETTLLILISGGASSLLECPVEGIGLPELARLNQWLLASGLPIEDMNRVRKSVSRLKAGGLLPVIGARPVRALAISDVPDDRIAVIGSGLLVPEPDLHDRVGPLALPDWAAAWVSRGLRTRGTLPPVGPEIELIATLAKAKSAVAVAAKRRGLNVWLHEETITGDAADLGRALAQALMGSAPGLHIWGGETTLRLPASPGRGGRNQHLALAAAIEIAGHADCLLLSLGTDGTDGPTEDAGALVDGHSLERAQLAGCDASAHLARADAGTLLEASGDLIRTGPTGTNVMDLILGLKT
ncbi:glycerate kinase type-2 family protein [Thiocystis violacea]|uniref:glycerate kinase type-2 family protein n=1 Tax=Thiocystis violacea TaxID=13725 RepID=UPI0019043031|nr:DUF4147 domain-containing protein [Thiocystis violacea]MBK1722918.1 hydroxypyruvate reductase [Thiocystis violacea]